MDKFASVFAVLASALLLLPSSPTVAFRVLDPPPQQQDGHHVLATPPPPPPPYDPTKEVKFMFLVVHWPPAVCHFRACNPGVQTKQDAFTIHGLWPAGGSNDKPIPGKSCPQTAFNMTELAGMEAELESYWPSLESTKTDQQFWEHEWEKHGVCGKPMLKEYFENALELIKDKVDTLKLLTESGITVGSDPQMGNVLAAVKKQGVTPSVGCSKTKGVPPSDYYYLKQIYWCVDPLATKLIDCPTSPKLGNCPANDADPIKLLAAPK